MGQLRILEQIRGELHRCVPGPNAEANSVRCGSEQYAVNHCSNRLCQFLKRSCP